MCWTWIAKMHAFQWQATFNEPRRQAMPDHQHAFSNKMIRIHCIWNEWNKTGFVFVTFQSHRPVITEEFVELGRKFQCITEGFGMNNELAHDRKRTQTALLFVKTDMLVLSHHPQHFYKAGILFR